MTDAIKLKKFIADEIIKCKKDPVYFFKEYVWIQHPVQGRIKFKLYPFQEKVLRDLNDNQFNIILKSRQLGISTLCAGLITWLIVFHKDMNVLVVATKTKTAKNMITKVEFAYENLPNWMLDTLGLKTTEFNKLSLGLNNGSLAKAASAAGDDARSEALSLLVIDECQRPEDQIVIKNKHTGEIVELPIGDAYHIKPEIIEDGIKTMNGWLILSSDNNWSEFDGIAELETNIVFNIKLSNGKEINCTSDHLIKYINGEFLEACFVEIGDILYNNIVVTAISYQEIQGTKVYSISNVKNKEEYYSNGIIHHNCAFIKNAEEVWTSAQSTLSTGGKGIILSTPNGSGGWFYKTWLGAIEGENGINPIRLDWRVHPDRDQAWRDDQTLKLGVRKAAQECNAEFISSGESVVDGEIVKWYEDTLVKDPLYKRYANELWLWDYPDSTKKYLIPVDVSRGDGTDYSAFHIIDIESLEQVGEFKSKVPVKELAKILIATGYEWNNAIISVENAQMGWGVLQDLIELQYSNLYYTPKKEIINDYEYIDDTQFVPGFTNSAKTRPLIISKIEDYINNKLIVLRGIRSINELKVFVWRNHRAEAQTGYNDDLTMALGEGLFIRDTSLRKFNKGLYNYYMNQASNTDIYEKYLPVYNAAKLLSQAPKQKEIDTFFGQQEQIKREIQRQNRSKIVPLPC